MDASAVKRSRVGGWWARRMGIRRRTTTSLFTTPDNPSSGAVITMTAQVSATEFTVAGGTVTFTDTYNGVTEALGTVQVQSTNGNPGTAILEVEVGGVGSSINSSPTMAAPQSSRPVRLLRKSVTFSGPYLTSTALASSGAAGNYTLTGTVSAFGPVTPTGSVTFTDTTSNFTLGTATLNASTLQTGFTPYTLYPIANMNNGQTGSTIGPAIGDFNGDGRPDYAVPTNTGPIVILLGAGNGTFTNGTTINTTSPFSQLPSLWEISTAMASRILPCSAPQAPAQSISTWAMETEPSRQPRTIR